MSLQKLSSKDCLFSLQDITVFNEGKLTLKNISVNFYKGKVYSIFGEHGSGKTSLCKTIIGEIKPQKGELLLDGTPLKHYNLKKSKSYSIFSVDQHILGPDNLTVSDYFFLTDLRPGNWLHNRDRINNEKVKIFLNEHNINIDPQKHISSLSFQEKVIVDIFQKMYMNPRLLILDETIDKLSQEYKDIVFNSVKNMKDKGHTILIVTHDIHEAHKKSDRILIMRNGEIIFRDSIKSVDDISIIRMAYTQALNTSETSDTNTNFYSLLKFNQAILEELPISLMVIDSKNTIKISNAYAKKLFEKEDISNNKLEVVLKENLELAEQIIKMTSRNSVVSKQGLSIKIGNNFRIINLTICPVIDNTVKMGNLIFIDDVSEHEFLRQQIIQKDKYASLGIFTSGIAHEINNPLEIIVNCLDYLNISIENEDFRRKIHYIEEEIDRISGIIKNLGSYAQPGKTPVMVKINLILSEMIEMMKPYTESHNTIIEYYPGENISAVVDGAEIKQVLLNIIKNAVDAIEDYGLIKISDRLLKNENEERFQIIIEDNGTGIPETEINNLFLPFYSTKSQKNMGLGLYICYQIINKYMGTISFEKIVPKGTRCIIELPVGTD